MNEKISLTQDQADAIERLKKFIRDDETLDCQFNVKYIARVLLEGYEIKPKYSVGDWVITEGYSETYDGRALKIIKISELFGEKFYYFENSEKTNHNFSERSIKRHATKEDIEKEKERQWWAKHGREPWELKKNDVLAEGIFLYTVEKFLGEIVCLNKRTVPIHLIKENFKVVCFAEDREDL